MRAPAHAYPIAAAILALAISAAILARKAPPWRPLAASLALLAAIDVARLWTAPLAQQRVSPWWGVDVALVAMWPVAVGVGLLRAQNPGNRSREGQPGLIDVGDIDGEVNAPCDTRRGHLREVRGRTRDAARSVDLVKDDHGDEGTGVRAAVGIEEHAANIARNSPIALRLLTLAVLAFALGAARPWLPRLAYLSALRLPRWALAALWVEAMLRVKVVGDHREVKCGADGAVRTGRGPCVGGPALDHRPMANAADGQAEDEGDERGEHARHPTTLPLACSLILAGTHTADLLAGAWMCAPWEAPAWGYARAVTWAAYVAVGVVMGWGWRKG